MKPQENLNQEYLDLKEAREKESIDNKILYTNTIKKVKTQYINTSGLGIGKTTKLFREVLDNNFNLVYVGSKYDDIDDIYNKLIYEFKVLPDKILYLKSYSKITKDLILNSKTNLKNYLEQTNKKINQKVEFNNVLYNEVNEYFKKEIVRLNCDINDKEISMLMVIFKKYVFLNDNQKVLVKNFIIDVENDRSQVKELFIRLFETEENFNINKNYILSAFKRLNECAKSIKYKNYIFDLFDSYSIFSPNEITLLGDIEKSFKYAEEERISPKVVMSIAENTQDKEILSNLLNLIKFIHKEQTNDIEEKQIVLTSNKKFFSKEINVDLFEDKPKIFAYDESGVELYEEVMLNHNYQSKLTKILKEKENPMSKNLLELNFYYERINDLKEFLKEKTKYNDNYTKFNTYTKRIETIKNISFLNNIEDDDIEFNKHLDGIMFSILSIINYNKNSENYQMLYDYYDKNQEEMLNSIEKKILFLDRLFKEFIVYIRYLKQKIIVDENVSLKGLNKETGKTQYHNNFSIKMIENHRTFFNNFLKHRVLVKHRREKYITDLIVPNFQTFEKINELAKSFNITIMDATFNDKMFFQMRKYLFELPKKFLKDTSLINEDNFQNIIIKGTKIKNKETIVIHIDKYYNSKTYFGMNNKFWIDKSCINGIKFIIRNIKSFKKEIFCITHKDKSYIFKEDCVVFWYPAEASNRFKNMDVLLNIGQKHFGNDEYYKRLWFYNDCLPETLQDKDVSFNYMKNSAINSMSIQALGRIRPFTNNKIKVIVIFGQVDEIEDMFTVVKPEKNIHLAILPFLINKLQEVSLNDYLKFEIDLNKYDKLLMMYFLQTINKVRIDYGEKSIRKLQSIKIRKSDFLRMLEKFEISNIKNKKEIIKLMFNFYEFKKLRYEPSIYYRKTNSLVWFV